MYRKGKKRSHTLSLEKVNEHPHFLVHVKGILDTLIHKETLARYNTRYSPPLQGKEQCMSSGSADRGTRLPDTAL